MEVTELYKAFIASTGVSTDTRSLLEGNLFFALQGDNFDGNQYASKALEIGASAVVVSRDMGLAHQFVVKDTLSALQQLGTHHRTTLETPLIALTGSNGKTTTKELLHACLSAQYHVLATIGNLNNHIGVPLTLLRLTPEHDYGIIEMGANHAGEIDALCKIALPDYGYITNFGKAHLEGFGSLEGVEHSKSELYRHLATTDGLAFVNGQDEKQLVRTADQRRAILNTETRLEPKIHGLRLQLDEVTVTSLLEGSYNAINIAAAMRIAQQFGVTLEQSAEAVATYNPSNNRSQRIHAGDLAIILDAYNANPSSMQVALENLNSLPGKKHVILGDMKELGNTTELEHQRTIERLLGMDLETRIVVGPAFAEAALGHDAIQTYENIDALIKSMQLQDLETGTLLIKGSRSMALERFVPSNLR